jgi:GNAT superfamily N-acetyltransferase
MRNMVNALVRFLLNLERQSKRSNTDLLRQRGEEIQSLIIRQATSADIPKLAALHVKTWSDTYRRSKYKPTYALREQQWRQLFSAPAESWFCFVVENKKGELIGFAKANDYRGDLPGFSGELNKIYLLREYQRLGLGRNLVGHVARKFIDKGISTMVLFSTPQNPSCYFFEKLEGERLTGKNGEFHGGYGWKDLGRLAKICVID